MLPIVETKISTEEFQITDWAAQIAELQARIAASQQRITRLNEDNAVADGLLQAAQAAKGKISDQEIIADLLAQLSRLFGGDNTDDCGNIPLEPAPQPNDDGGAEVAIAVEPQPEPLTGQYCDWASPLATPFASPLATPLCCHLSDAPQSVLKGQLVEIACVVSDAPKKPEYIELMPLSREVHYQRRTHDGEIICCYVGFNNKTKAKQWGEFLAVHHSVAAGFQLRASERLTAFKWEIKLWGMNLKQIEKLAGCDLQKLPPSNFGTAPTRLALEAPPAHPNFEVGDIVASKQIANWQYEIIEVLADGAFKGKRLGVDQEMVFTLAASNLNLISKAVSSEPKHITIDVNDVPVGARLERTDDALVTEYRLWIWCVARVKGKPEVQQQCIGTIVEGTKGISAYRVHGLGQRTQVFTRTLEAVKYLVSTSDYRLNDIEAAYSLHQEEIGLASIQPPEPQQEIHSGDWVELLVNGDRYQVDSVDSEGIHLVTDDGNMLAQPDEVKLLMKIPANWQPF